MQKYLMILIDVDIISLFFQFSIYFSWYDSLRICFNISILFKSD